MQDMNLIGLPEDYRHNLPLLKRHGETNIAVATNDYFDAMTTLCCT